MNFYIWAKNFYQVRFKPWWERYHNHIYGLIGVLGTAVTFFQLSSCWPAAIAPSLSPPPPSISLGTPLPPAPPPKLRIVELLPNPVRPEARNEYVTIKNFDTTVVDLTGWKVRDDAFTTWRLDQQLPLEPSEERKVFRNGAMNLNNNGDVVELVSPTGEVAHRIEYPKVKEGQVVTFDPR